MLSAFKYSNIRADNPIMHPHMIIRRCLLEGPSFVNEYKKRIGHFVRNTFNIDYDEAYEKLLSCQDYFPIFYLVHWDESSLVEDYKELLV